MVELIRNINERQVLVKDTSGFYIVSENKEESKEWLGYSEVLAFKSNEKAEILDWVEVAGQRQIHLNEFLSILLTKDRVSDW